MSPSPEDQWRPPEPPGRPPRTPGGGGGPGSPARPPVRPRWMPWVILGLVLAIFLVWRAAPGTTQPSATLDYGSFLTNVSQGHVKSIKYDGTSGKITGQFSDTFNIDGKKTFTTQGPIGAMPDAVITPSSVTAGTSQ